MCKDGSCITSSIEGSDRDGILKLLAAMGIVKPAGRIELHGGIDAATGFDTLVLKHGERVLAFIQQHADGTLEINIGNAIEGENGLTSHTPKVYDAGILRDEEDQQELAKIVMDIATSRLGWGDILKAEIDGLVETPGLVAEVIN